MLPDLRYMVPGKHIVFEDVVLGGILQEEGMVSFSGSLNKDDAKELIANNVLAISEGANMPTDRTAIKMFIKNKILADILNEVKSFQNYKINHYDDIQILLKSNGYKFFSKTSKDVWLALPFS